MSLIGTSFITAILALTLHLSVFCQTDDEVISVDSTLVVLNASIKDSNGRHVPGLKESQFTIIEDGIAQSISFFEAEETPFAAVILIDTSGSMGSNVTLARSAAIRFLDGLRSSDSAAIYKFDSKVEKVQDFSNSRDVSENIYSLRADGMTVLNDAVFKAAELLSDRPEKRRAIIVLSDGADSMSGKSADRALKAALAVNAVIYTVDMSVDTRSNPQNIANRGVLRNFSVKSGGTFISTPGGAEMREAFAKIVEDLGIQYTLGYSPQNVKKDGKWRSIELKVARPNLMIRTRKGYNAEKLK